ncbi:MAG TPA: ribose 1,5-bisphosphate isomerase [Methanocorpusculum sp.]|nr:ribose 1,5-bisphosphate isomerase [Methanocorpusculum sp.]
MSLLDTAEKIKSMEIRGAGKIARSAAAALRDHALEHRHLNLPEFITEMNRGAEILVATRPTAVSLPNAVRITIRGLKSATSTEDAVRDVVDRADTFIRKAESALDTIAEICAARINDGDTIMTHCNSKAALAGIIRAKEQGKDIKVIATEVRPWNQGLLTIQTLNEHKIPTTYIVDSAVRYFMPKADLVIVGADAITSNGAVINKIGTSQLAAAAHNARKNFIVAAETFKFAPQTMAGTRIEIEERPTAEILPDEIARELPYVTIRNPVFDVTPAGYVDLIATEEGAMPPQLAYFIIKEHLGWEASEL